RDHRTGRHPGHLPAHPAHRDRPRRRGLPAARGPATRPRRLTPVRRPPTSAQHPLTDKAAPPMSRNKTADLPRQDVAWVTAAECFAGGQRIPYDPASARVLTEKEAAATPGEATILTFPGGHLTTAEHPDLLAAAIRGIAERHGVGTPAPARP